MAKLTAIVRQSLLWQCADEYGYDTMEDMFAASVCDSLVPCICHKCGYTCEYEPDCIRGWCEECESNSVISVLVLAGMI